MADYSKIMGKVASNLGATASDLNLGNTGRLAGLGSQLGSAFGPIGTGVGLGVGALAGGAMDILGLQKAKEEEWNNYTNSIQQEALQNQYQSKPAFKYGGGVMTEYKGNADKVDGIELDNKFVSNGEVQIGNYIFSNHLTPEGSNKTFAQLARHIDNKYKGRENAFTKVSREREVNELVNKHDKVRETIEDSDSDGYKYGGYEKPKYVLGGGEEPWSRGVRNDKIKKDLDAIQAAHISRMKAADKVTTADPNLFVPTTEDITYTPSIDPLTLPHSIPGLNTVPGETSFGADYITKKTAPLQSYKVEEISKPLNIAGPYADVLRKTIPKIKTDKESYFDNSEQEIRDSIMNPRNNVVPKKLNAVPTQSYNAGDIVNKITTPLSIDPNYEESDPNWNKFNPNKVSPWAKLGEYASVLAPSAVGAATSALLASKVNYDRVSPTFTDYRLNDSTQALNQVGTAFSGQNNALQASSTAGGYMTNRLASAALEAQKRGEIARAYSEANTGVINNANQFNAGIQNETDRLNANIQMEELANRLSGYGRAASNFSTGAESAAAVFQEQRRLEQTMPFLGSANFKAALDAGYDPKGMMDAVMYGNRYSNVVAERNKK
jgi:hypothetical protein